MMTALEARAIADDAQMDSAVKYYLDQVKAEAGKGHYCLTSPVQFNCQLPSQAVINRLCNLGYSVSVGWSPESNTGDYCISWA
jgi:hypothetical protein